jgi:diguanylate cyclase (GGDEF)-like protein
MTRIHPITSRLTLLLVASALPLSGAKGQQSIAASYRPAAEKLVAASLADEVGYADLAYLCDHIGKRISGSPSLDRAIAWSAETMKAAGLVNVHTQAATVPHWVRGEESGEIVEPVAKKLHLLGLGMSVATPPGGITAEVVVVPDFAALQKLGRAGVAGKIVVYNAPYVGYGQTVMRTPDDVTVLRSPSWWSKTHTVASLSGALATIITVLGWVVLLRRRVEQKTRELRSSEERYRNLAEHDPLTGAPNRALFRDRMRIALERAKRQGLRVGLLLLDLDRFKPINDELGHEAGDRVLCALVDRASSAVRKSDTVARLGGDEFAVLVPDLDTAEEALMVAEKILRAVCQPLAVSEREVAVSTSLGVAVYPDDGASLEELLRNADAAMYQSKKQGRGGMERYQPEPVETTIKGDVGLVAAVVSQRG